MQKVVPFLWFDKNAEEAMNFYVDIFNGSPGKSADSKIISIKRYEKGINAPGMPEMEGKVLTGVFVLNGQKFMALDGGPVFKFNESISLYVECENQAEIDYFWQKLQDGGGKENVCGWLYDKYGLAWQVHPKNMSELTKSTQQFNEMLKMKKIIIADLEKAG
ncbi:MAG TPA: VOC family protein [Candidatus Saccharimonadales bacterium]|nr:VOC family protein [Candidatus Saccharimonadales bacterium]